MFKAYFEKKLLDNLENNLDAMDALRYATGTIEEEVSMLPKDLLDDLEKLDEKRVNEHLNKPEEARVSDFGRSVAADPWLDAARMAQQQALNQLMNQQMANQQMIGASAYGMIQQNSFGQLSRNRW